MSETSENSKILLCRHVFANGELCRSAAVKFSEFCHWHLEADTRKKLGKEARGREARVPGVELPLIEDPHALQQAIADTLSAIVDGRLGEKKARLLLYGFQLALFNVHQLQRLDPAGKRTLSACPLWTRSLCKKRRSRATETGTCDPCDFGGGILRNRLKPAPSDSDASASGAK